jgi:hypothetical protein
MSGAGRKSDSNQHAECVRSHGLPRSGRCRAVATFLLMLAMSALLAACGGSSSTGEITVARSTGRTEPSKAFVTKGPNGELAKLGKESTPEEREAASAAIEESLDYRAESNFAAQCKTLVPKVAKETADQAPKLGPHSCVASIKALARGVKKSVLVSTMVEPIAALRVDGARAYAFYFGSGRERYVFPLERVGGQWKPAALGGFSLELPPQ